MSLSVEIVGLREASGRFARMANGELQAIAYERAAVMAQTAEAVFKRDAPRSTAARDDRSAGRSGHFADSFHGVAAKTGVGFEVSVSTSQPDIAKWLRDGTAPHEIRPRTAQALHWVSTDGDVWARIVHHPGTKANPWEEKARAELEPVLTEEGNKIGARVAQGLSGTL